MTREEEVRIRMEFLGVDRVTAEFIVAIEMGEIYGDAVALDENGREVAPERQPNWLLAGGPVP